MIDKIHYPAMCFSQGRIWVHRPMSPWTVKGIREMDRHKVLLCDSRGDVFHVGEPIPERPISIADRLLNRWMRARFGLVERVEHWTLEEFKAHVCEGLARNKDFFEASQSVVLWKKEVSAAASYREIMELLHPEEE